MSKGRRDDTKQWIEAERIVDPLSLGPFLGHHALALDIPNALLAEAIGVHEQTVLRWVTRRAAIPPKWASKVMKVLSVLCWMHDEQHAPLVGTTQQKERQLAAAITTFFTVAGAIQKTTASAE